MGDDGGKAKHDLQSRTHDRRIPRVVNQMRMTFWLKHCTLMLCMCSRIIFVRRLNEEYNTYSLSMIIGISAAIIYAAHFPDINSKNHELQNNLHRNDIISGTISTPITFALTV